MNYLHDNCFIRQQRENHSSTLPNIIRRKAIQPISLQQADGERPKNFQVLKKVEGRNSLIKMKDKKCFVRNFEQRLNRSHCVKEKVIE